MRRRDFIKGIFGSATAWPLAALAQQPEQMRRIGVLMSLPADDPEGQARLTGFLHGLQELGWSVGRNVIVDIRWSTGNSADTRKYAMELVALAPDVILANSSIAVASLQQVTGTIPIVFAGVADPVGAGYVDSLARPGGNVSGFTSYEYSISGKWLELLREISPSVMRVAVLRDASISVGPAQFAAIQAVASSLGVELRPVDVSNGNEIERAVTTFAQNPNSGTSSLHLGSPPSQAAQAATQTIPIVDCNGLARRSCSRRIGCKPRTSGQKRNWDLCSRPRSRSEAVANIETSYPVRRAGSPVVQSKQCLQRNLSRRNRNRSARSRYQPYSGRG
jgi:hypothetical protein